MAVRDTVAAFRAVVVLPAFSAAAELTRTTRPLSARDVADVVVVVAAPPPRGFCAGAAIATPHAKTAQIANEILKKSTNRVFKITSLLAVFYHIPALLINSQFTRYSNLLHFLPSHPNDEPPNVIP